MAEWLWRQAHTTSDRVENDPRTLAEVLRCLMCELSYNPDSNDVVGRETLLNRYSQLMSSRLSGEGVKDIADISQAANHQKNGEEGDWQSELNFEEFSARLAPSRDEMGSKAVEVPQLVRDRVAQFLRGDQAGQHPPNTGSSSHAVEDRSIPLSGGFHVPARMAAANPTQQFTTSLTHKNNDVGGAGNSEVDDQGQFPSFKSAREQLLLNNKKVAPTNSSGQPKKSLGPRRQTNKFTSPIVADQTPTARSEATWVADCAGVEDELPEELAHLDPATVKLIISEIMDTNASVSWNDIAGLQFAKKTLKEIIILPMLRPDIFTGLRGPPRGLLLFGPPGTGKTLIGKCVASQSKCTFFSISASSLTSKWVGEGEKMVRTLFAVARCKQPSVIFIDEIDSLLTQRSESEHESSRRIKTEFLVQMDGVTCGEEDRVLVIGATNRPQELDEAARRRFVKRLYIPLPESEARMTIVKGLMQRQSSQLSEGDLQAIVKQTEGYSGADMANLCKEAALGPVRDIHYEDIETITLDQVRPVVFADFNSALSQVRATVDSSDLHSYMSWNSKFGSWAIQHPQS